MYRKEFTNYRAENDPRLISVSGQLKALRKQISNIEWDGGDASALRLKALEFFRAEQRGIQFLPRF